MNPNKPKTLYKFRDWSNEYHRRMLMKKELFFSNSYSFNDPFDLHLPLLYSKKSLTDFDFFYNLKKEDLDRLELDHESLKSEWMKHVEANPEMAIPSESIVNKFKKEIQNEEDKLGVYCLSKTNNSNLMWGHYSDSHRGFCVGLDHLKLLNHLTTEFENNECSFHEVDYKSEIPTYEFNNRNKREYVIKRQTTKFSDWSYENEVRIILENSVNKTQQLPANTFSEIIFGYKMDDFHREEITLISNILFPKIKFFEAKPSMKKFEMEITPI